jgi:predicted fused transcriptional regulator/phosphomethylpyrimidine kinase
LCDRGEVQALEGRKHAELKLDVVLGGGDEGSEVVVGVLGDLDLEVLCSLVKAMQ